MVGKSFFVYSFTWSCFFCLLSTTAATMIVPKSKMIVVQIVRVMSTPLVMLVLRLVVVLLLPVWRRIRAVVRAVGLLAAIGRVVWSGRR